MKLGKTRLNSVFFLLNIVQMLVHRIHANINSKSETVIISQGFMCMNCEAQYKIRIISQLCLLEACNQGIDRIANSEDPKEEFYFARIQLLIVGSDPRFSMSYNLIFNYCHCTSINFSHCGSTALIPTNIGIQWTLPAFQVCVFQERS